MNLEEIRSKLERLEDTICINLFERSQFKRNLKIYKPQDIYSRVPRKFL
jgi:hypothetical protein